MLQQCSSRQTSGESECHKTRVLKSPRKHALNESPQAMGQLVKNMKVGCKTSESVSYLSMRTAVKSDDVEFRKKIRSIAKTNWFST